MPEPASAKPAKSCFVICPIGADSSDERKRSDEIFDFIISPVVQDAGYLNPTRSDKLSTPGDINRQVIDRLINDDLVIADLTDHNPNVFFELAVRFAVHKPVVQLIRFDQRIPFDVGSLRTIFFDHTTLTGGNKCKIELAGQIKNLEADPAAADNPIFHAINILAKANSTVPADVEFRRIYAALETMSGKLDYVLESYRALRASSIRGEERLAIPAVVDLSKSIVLGRKIPGFHPTDVMIEIVLELREQKIKADPALIDMVLIFAEDVIEEVPDITLEALVSTAVHRLRNVISEPPSSVQKNP